MISRILYRDGCKARFHLLHNLVIICYMFCLLNLSKKCNISIYFLFSLYLWVTSYDVVAQISVCQQFSSMLVFSASVIALHSDCL